MKEHRDREKGDVKREVETGVMQLQPQECQGCYNHLKPEERHGIVPSLEPPEETRPADTLISHFWTLELFCCVKPRSLWQLW